MATLDSPPSQIRQQPDRVPDWALDVTAVLFEIVSTLVEAMTL